MRRLPCLCLAAALLARSSEAFADDPARARELFDAGAQAYGVGAFAEAVRAFDAAYRAAPSPPILFSLSQAQRRLYVVDRRRETLEQALAGFTKYLDQMPVGGRRADAAQAAEAVQATLRSLPASSATPTPPPPKEKKVGTLILSSPTPGATLSVDGQATSPVPFAGDVPLGTHSLVVSAPGYLDTKRDVPFLEGSLVTLDVPLVERPASLRLTTEAATSVLVDGRPSGTAPLARPLELPSGRHVFTLLRNGRVPVSEEIELGSGEAKDVRRELRASPQRNVALVLTTVGGVAVVAGGAFALVAFTRQSAAQDIRDERAKTAITPLRRDDYQDAVSGRDRWRTAAIATGSAGAGVFLAGVFLAVFDEPSSASVSTKALPPKPKDEPKTLPKPVDAALLPRFAPVLGTSYTGLSAYGHF